MRMHTCACTHAHAHMRMQMRMHTCACTHAHMRIINSTLDHSQEAGDAARYTHSGSSQPTGQIMDDGGVVQLEGSWPRVEPIACRHIQLDKGATAGHRLVTGWILWIPA